MMLFLPCVQANRTRCVLHVCEDGRCVSSHDKHTSQPQPHYTSAHLWYLPAARGSPGPGAARNGQQTSARHGGGRRELGHEVPQCDLGLANVSLKLLSPPFSHVQRAQCVPCVWSPAGHLPTRRRLRCLRRRANQ